METVAMVSPHPPLHVLLRPWVDTLVQMRIRPVKHLLNDAVPTVSIVWMCPRDHRTRSFEAIELFLLLAKADAAAWRCFVEELQAASGPWFAYQWASIVLEPEQLPRVAGVDLVCTQLEDATQLTVYLQGVSTEDDAPSEEYKQLRRLLEGGLEDATVAVRLRIKPGRPWRANMMEALPAIAELGALQANAAQEKNEDALVQKCRLSERSCRIVAVHNDIAEFTRVDESYLDEMMVIYGHGIRVADLPPLQLVQNARNSPVHVRSLNKLLGSTVTSGEGCIQRVVISRLDTATVAPGLLSAVACSQSVREIAVNFQLATGSLVIPQRAIYWLAFALFSPLAGHSVIKTRVNCDALTSEHVTWMRELLEAEDPLLLLFNEEPNHIAAYQDTRVSTSKLFLQGAEEDGSVVEDVEFESLRVISRYDGSWCVFLPGWGRAWVQDCDATVSVQAQTYCPSSTCLVRPIRQLELWGFREDNKPQVLELLQLIGHSVHGLELLDRDGSLDVWCPGVFQACPNLEDFHLWQASSEDLLGFAESFANQHCRRLKRLSLEQNIRRMLRFPSADGREERLSIEIC